MRKLILGMSGSVPGLAERWQETFQLPAVRPAFWAGGAAKVTTVSSKVKSPWNPTKLRLGSMKVVRTGSMITVVEGTEVVKIINR